MTSKTLFVPYNKLLEVGENEIVESGEHEIFNPLHYGFNEFLAHHKHFIRIVSQSGKPIKYLFKSEKPFISLVFSFNGSSTVRNITNNKILAEISKNQCGIIYINDQTFENNWDSESGAELFIINVSPEYFTNFLYAGHPLYDPLQETVVENLPVLLNEKTLEISGRMRLLLSEVFQSGLKGHYKRLFLKSKFIELLMLLFQDYELVYNQLPEICTSNANLEKMYEVRDIIDSNFAKPCSLLDLAQQVGTNECYLKKHFKQVFGTTVFGYVHTQRMLRSKEMLLNEDKKIAEIAKLSGYKHASHFTTAFKKYFGFLPHQIKVLLFPLLGGEELALCYELLMTMPI